MKNKTLKSNLWILLGTLKDFRRTQGRRHSLQIILLVIILAIMSGAKTERAIARFVQNNKKVLIKTLKIKRKEVPSRHVIQSVIQFIDFYALQKIFYAWASKIITINKKDFVSIDGKAIRGTVKDGQNSLQTFVSLVSVFVGRQKQVLIAEKIQTKKESEIPAVPELIKMLDLQDITFTLDALHCQTKTLKTIVKSGNHYIVGVKGNQPKLLAELKKTVTIRSQNSPRKK